MTTRKYVQGEIASLLTELWCYALSMFLIVVARLLSKSGNLRVEVRGSIALLVRDWAVARLPGEEP